MIGNQESEIVPTITELPQIGNENKDSVIDEQDIYDNNRLETDIQETETETMALNAAFEKPSYFCDNCAGYTLLAQDLVGNGNECAHCEESLFAEDLDTDTDIIIPVKPLGTLKMVVSGNLLKTIVGNIGTLVEEVKLNIFPDKITVRCVDPAHVAMLEMDVPRSMFDSYHADTFDLGIDIEKLREIVKQCKKDSRVKFELAQVDNKDILQYNVGILSGNMSLVDTAGLSDPKVPNVNLPAHFDISVKDLLDFIKRAETLTDHITIFAERDKVTFSAEGETDNTKMVLTNDQEIQFLEIKDQDSARSLFALSYLSSMIKALKPCAKTITIELGTDYPIRVKTNLFNGEGDVTYLLAPRIETDN